MAFVFRSPKKNDLNKQNNTTTEFVGPGSYLGVKNHNIGKENKFLFLIGSKKNKFEAGPSNETPGPGSYFKETSRFKNELDQIEIGSKSPLYKVLDYDEIAKNSKFAELLNDKMKPTGFLNKDKRFGNARLENIPGPGHYNRTDLNFFEMTKEKIDFENKKKILSKSKKEHVKAQKFTNPSVSIPTKNQAFGYKVASNGEIVPNEFNNAYLESEVSPCSYDIFNYTKNSWCNKTLSSIWSRSKTQKGIHFGVKEPRNNNSKNKEAKFLETISNNDSKVKTADQTFYSKAQGNQTSINFRRSLTMMNITKSNFERKENYKIVSEEKKQLVDVFNSESKEMPGPGYYHPSITQKIANIPESFQSFGSHTVRFKTSIGFSTEDNPGPGSYFNLKEANRHAKKMHATKASSKVLIAKRLKTSISQPKKVLPGPGDYEPIYDSNINKKKILSNTKGIFGSTENRFIKKKDTREETLGPGAYISMHDYLKTSEVVNPYKMNLKKGTIAEVRSVTQEREKERFPSVGHYDPDKIYNIESRLRKNVNKVSAVFAPFNSKQKRFEKIKKDKYKFNIGPGYYFKEKKLDFTQKGPAFNATSSKEAVKPSGFSENLLGPGNYNVASLYDWNKRSYNLHFA